MPLLKEIDLGRSIRNNDIANIYFFYGKDVSTISAYTKKLINRLVPAEEQAMNYQKFDGKNFDISAFADCCEVYPMFSQRVVVSVNDLNIDSVKAEDYKYLKQILTSLPETTTVIFFVTGIDIYKSKIKLTDKNQKFVDFCVKNGVACDFALKTVSEMGKTIAQKVTKNNCVISKKNAEYLAEKCNGDMIFANNETDKICAYVDGGEITEEVIDLLCVRKLDADAFKLASAIVRQDSKRVFTIIDELFSLQNDAFSILSAISMNFVDIYRASVGKGRGKTPSKIASDFSYPKYREFAVTNAYKECSNIIPKRLRKCMRILSKTDIAMKSQRTDNRLLLEKAIVEMLN